MLLGRDAEIEWLGGQLRDGPPVAVHGELGIGKSALIRAAAAADGRRVLVGGGLASLAWSSYLPLVRAIRVPLPSGDRAIVAAYVAHRVRDGLLILDDLQYADPDTLAALPAIAQRVRLLLAFRDGEPGSDRAAAAARACGCEMLRLEALDQAHAIQLVRARRSTLTELEARELAASAGGNPLLLQELALDVSPGGLGTGALAGIGAGAGASFVQRRLGRLSQDAREAVAMLGLLGRAAAPELLGEAAAELLNVSLVERDGALLALRHPVFGEQAIGLLDAPSRRRLHARLAAQLADPGERARHLAAAGALDAARAAALEAARAARHTSERGRHLGLAAECVTGPESDRLRLVAADLLAGAGEYAAVERLLARCQQLGGPQAAEVALRRSRAVLALGSPREAHALALEGLALAQDPGPLQLALRIERLRCELAGGDPAAVLLAEGLEVAALCELASVAEARAAVMLGSIQLAAAAADWSATLQRALTLARMGDEFDVESAAASLLILGHLLAGETVPARELAVKMEERCAARLLRGTGLSFAAGRLWLDLHARGACAEVIESCRTLLSDPVPDALAIRFHALLALALADTGELREAELVVERALTRAGRDPGRSLSWTHAEVLWLSGRPGEAATLARECRDDPLVVYPVGALAAVTAAWAALEAGGAGGDAIAGGDASDGEGARGGDTAGGETGAFAAQSCGGSDAELTAVGHLQTDPAGARDAFLLGSRAWTGIERRGELRCAWAAAEAARRAGARDDAVAALRQLRDAMSESGIIVLTGRVNRSLREAGVREGSARSADERGLTAREREILALVGQGLGTSAIARSLGLEATTVETHIESAREKLGAANRTQAAILAAG
ncbi:MAG: LuxR C-terminal-related transcriptional regulator [Solirubrobacteraceae bacterium]